MISLASNLDPSLLRRWWGPGFLMTCVIGILVAADLLLDGLLNHVPWWLIVVPIVAPWILPLLSLARRSWREAAIRAISLATGTCIGMVCLWLIYASLNEHSLPHPFPHSLESTAKSGILIHEPLDRNDALPSRKSDPREHSIIAAQIASQPPDFFLNKGFQGGMYAVEIHANPGEPGTLFLRAFEPSTNTPLSEDPLNAQKQLSVTTRHTANYSSKPNEAFVSLVDFKLTEGGWNQFYAARFELWFAPASDAPPRRLHTKVFRVEGWQR
jgi:hypothetical protein